MSDSKTVYLDLSRDNDGRGNQEEELEGTFHSHYALLLSRKQAAIFLFTAACKMVEIFVAGYSFASIVPHPLQSRLLFRCEYFVAYDAIARTSVFLTHPKLPFPVLFAALAFDPVKRMLK